MLLRQWHWKAALFSASTRALIFLITTQNAGWRAAAGAMAVEFLLRVATAGFFGSFTQSLRCVQPAWHGTVVALVVLPLSAHGLEFAVHFLRHTPHLASGIKTSVGFTILSTLFHLYSTRQGAYLTGERAGPLAEDLRRTPTLIAGFLAAGLRWIGGVLFAPRNQEKT